MKKLPLTLLFAFVLSYSFGQVVCIQCFDQNDPINPLTTNLIRNGSFETTNCQPGWLSGSFCPNSILYDCDLENWQCTGGGSNSYPIIFDTTLCVIPDGQYAAYFGNGNGFVCADLSFDTSCLTRNGCLIGGIPSGFPRSLDGYGGETGVSLEQVVQNLTIGETYLLEFWAGGEPLNDLLIAPGIFAVDVGFGKTYLNCEPTSYDHNPLGTVYLIEFVATSTDHTIVFTNWGHMCADCTELVIDNVRLYTMAEAVTHCTTNTNETSHTEFEIYPNPVTTTFRMEGIERETGTAAVIFPNGRIAMHVPLHGSVDVNSLSSGLYFLVVSNKQQSMVKKFIKL